MNNCDFKEIIVIKDFEVENGLLGLERDVYLSIVKFLDSHTLRKESTSKYFLLFCLIILFYYYSNIPFSGEKLRFKNMCG
jgi:hypothetical protein